MDINDLRALTTVLSFAVFIGILVWAFSKRHKQDFEEAARLSLDLDEGPKPSQRN
jgi:cytochrome c oxidase cbb3-type subunit 4